tara:strand:- start:115 stop:951 length:837 start_codon:yes stop_codon:yes gene_type:complete
MNFWLRKKLIKMNYFILILFVFISIYLFILISTYLFQRNLLYHPGENNYSGDRLDVSVEKVKIKTQDNIELLSWYHNKNINNYKTILFLHGNAGSLENRIHKINNFKDMNINFLLLAWRGFSGNKGQPTEQNLYEDARSAIRWLESKGIKENNIIIYGESLGTGIATEIAQNKNFAGIILESPFTSMIEAGKTKYPFLPVRFLLKDKYESNKKIKNIKSPILIMHGKVDNIVPFYMGKKMYELANDPKYSYFSEYDDHMMEYNEKLLNVLKKFIYSLN